MNFISKKFYFCLVFLASFSCKVGADPCRSVLLPSRTSDDFHTYAREFGLPLLQTQPESSVLEWFGIDPHRYPQIVLFSLNNFFGDSMIFHFPMIDFFLKQFPEVPLKSVSPRAEGLFRSPYLPFESEFFPVRFAEYKKREDRQRHIEVFRSRMNGFIRRHIKPGALIFFDLTTLDKADWEMDPRNEHPDVRPSLHFRQALVDIGATGIGISNLSKSQHILRGLAAIQVIAPKDQIRSDVFNIPEAKALYGLKEKERIVGIEFRRDLDFGAETIVESWLKNVSLVIGPQVFLSWNSSYFVNTDEDPLNLEQFFSQTKLDTTKPYAMVNFNTHGGGKVEELKPIYAATLIQVLEHVMTTTDLNMLVTFPETQFGPVNQVQLMDYVSSRSSRIAFIPASQRELISALLSGTEWFVSYDSGLVHLANFLPPEKVLTISLKSGGPEIWRRPDQTYIKILPGEDPETLAPQVNGWIRSRTTFPSAD